MNNATSNLFLFSALFCASHRFSVLSALPANRKCAVGLRQRKKERDIVYGALSVLLPGNKNGVEKRKTQKAKEKPGKKEGSTGSEKNDR